MPKREMNINIMDVLRARTLAVTIKLGAADCGRSHRSAYWHEDKGTTSSGRSDATTAGRARITPYGDQQEFPTLTARMVESSLKSRWT